MFGLFLTRFFLGLKLNISVHQSHQQKRLLGYTTCFQFQENIFTQHFAAFWMKSEPATWIFGENLTKLDFQMFAEPFMMEGVYYSLGISALKQWRRW